MAAVDSTNETSPTVRFSLRGMFVVVLGLAVGLTVARWSRLSSFEALQNGALATTWVFFAFGLLAQARDLLRILHDQTPKSSDGRWGVRYAIAWRIVAVLLAALLIGFEGVPAEHAPHAQPYGVETVRPTILLLLTWLVILSTRPEIRPARRSRLLPRLIDAMGWLAAAVLLAMLCIDMTVLHVLVHLAIVGVSANEPAALSWFGPGIVVPAYGRFVWLTAAALVATLADLWLTQRLARRWNAGIVERSLLLILLGVGISVAVGYTVWFLMVGLHSIDPPFYEVLLESPVLGPAVAMGLALLAATALAYQRLATSALEGECCEFSNAHTQPYLHQRVSVLSLLLFAVVVLPVVDLCLAMAKGYYGNFRDFRDMLHGTMLYGPSTLVGICVGVAALAAVFRRWRSGGRDRSICIPPLPPAKSLTIWLAICVTVLTGIPILLWSAFCVWFVRF